MDDNGVKRYTSWDAANRVLNVVNALGNTVEHTYNSDGAVTRTDFTDIHPLNRAEYSRTEADLDFLNRTLKFRDQRYNISAHDTEVECAYDRLSRAVLTIDATGTISDNFWEQGDGSPSAKHVLHARDAVCAGLLNGVAFAYCSRQ